MSNTGFQIPGSNQSKNPNIQGQYYPGNNYVNQPNYNSAPQFNRQVILNNQNNSLVNQDPRQKLQDLKIHHHLKKPHVFITALALGMVVVVLILGLGYLALSAVNPGFSETTNKSNVSASSSLESFSLRSRSFSSRTFIGIFTDKSIISGEQGSSSSSGVRSSSSFSSVAPLFRIDLAPKIITGLSKDTSNFQVCGDSVQLVSGIVTYSKTLTDQSRQTMTIAHRNLFASQLDQTQFQLASNYIAGQTDFISDGNTDVGPDFLQVMRTSCSKSIINQVQPIDNLSYNGAQAWRGNYNLSGSKDFADIGVDIYATKGDYIIRLNQTLTQKSLLTSSQIQGCTKFTVTERNCITELVKKEDVIQKKLEEVTKSLVQNFELQVSN